MLLLLLLLLLLKRICRSHRWRDGPCNAIPKHWNVAIFRKIGVELEVLRAT